MSSEQKLVQAPTLTTILMVERALQGAGTVSVAELKRRLPRQVNHNGLTAILKYLEESDKIYVGMKGITWVHIGNERLRRALAKGVKH